MLKQLTAIKSSVNTELKSHKVVADQCPHSVQNVPVQNPLSVHTQDNRTERHASLWGISQYQYITQSANYSHCRDKM